MTRRSFVLSSLLFPFSASLFGITLNKKIINIDMKGDLDDDLFIIKTSSNKSDMLECLQMHNPRNEFIYQGDVVKSNPIYGIIDFDKKYNINENEILSLFVANEREELFDLQKLRIRSHFRAVDLKANKQVLIPSLLPENNDVENFPTWFGSEEDYCTVDGSKVASYNYYKLWENATCGGGFIIKNPTSVTIKLYSSNNSLMFTAHQNVTSKPKRIIYEEVINKKLDSHVLVEVDGGVYGSIDNAPNDEFVKEFAITKAIITMNEINYEISFPYPLPYPNRLYLKSIN